MNKKKSLIFIIFIVLIGSFVNFYSTNLLMSDLSNMFYGVHDQYIIASIPLFTIALDFVFIFIFVIRATRYPQYKKALVKLYTILLFASSLIGVVTSLISGISVYKDFLAPYPFTAYPLIMYTVHFLIVILSVFMFIFACKKMENDTEKKKIKFKYCLYSAFLGLMVYLAFYKFGCILWSPLYIHLRTLYLSFPFYLWILCPICLVVHVILYFFNLYKDTKTPIIFISIVGIVHIILGIVVIIVGATNSTLISAISPCLPLERLSTKPYDVLLEFVLVLGLCIYYLIYNIISRKKSLKENNK